MERPKTTPRRTRAGLTSQAIKRPTAVPRDLKGRFRPAGEGERRVSPPAWKDRRPG
jgi:hypothetical protein